MPLPYFLPIFVSLLDLLDLESILQSRTELENYILLVSKIPLMDDGSGDIDNFALDIDTVENMQQLIDSAVPDLVGTAYSPCELEKFTFEKSNTSQNVDDLNQSLSNLFAKVGISDFLFNDSKGTNSVGLKYSIKTDEGVSLKFLNRIQNWFQSYIKLNISEDFLFKFHLCTIFSQEDLITRLKEAATLGGSAMDYLTALGDTPYEAYCKLLMEQTLDIKSLMIPLSTSFTQGAESDTGGAPKKSEDELSEEGIDTRDAGKNEGTKAQK
nr:MAG TPA: portal protein [Caudoviricetes sp.]